LHWSTGVPAIKTHIRSLIYCQPHRTLRGTFLAFIIRLFLETRQKSGMVGHQKSAMVGQTSAMVGQKSAMVGHPGYPRMSGEDVTRILFERLRSNILYTANTRPNTEYTANIRPNTPIRPTYVPLPLIYGRHTSQYPEPQTDLQDSTKDEDMAKSI